MFARYVVMESWIASMMCSEIMGEKGRVRNAKHEAPHAWTNDREVVCRLGADAVPIPSSPFVFLISFAIHFHLLFSSLLCIRVALLWVYDHAISFD